MNVMFIRSRNTRHAILIPFMALIFSAICTTVRSKIKLSKSPVSARRRPMRRMIWYPKKARSAGAHLSGLSHSNQLLAVTSLGSPETYLHVAAVCAGAIIRCRYGVGGPYAEVQFAWVSPAETQSLHPDACKGDNGAKTPAITRNI